MAEERRQFPRRWPHLTTLYNASPFIRGPYKEVDDWSTLRPLPPTVGGYPPSYDDTYPKGDYGSYVSQRTTDKFGRSFVTAPPSNYDAFSISTYQSLPVKPRSNRRKWTGCLSFFIGLSLIISLIGAVVAIVIVLNSEERCDAYRDSVLVISSPYDHNKLVEGTSEYNNFTETFCRELESSFELFFIEDHICGCQVHSLKVHDSIVNVTFNILYRRLNATDSNSELVGAALGGIMYKILNDSLTDTFILSNAPLSDANPTPTPMPSVGNLTTSTPRPATIATPSTMASTTASTTPSGNLSSNGTLNATVSEEGVLKWNATLAGSDDFLPDNDTSTTATRQSPPLAVAPKPSSVTQSPTTQSAVETGTPLRNSSASFESSSSILQQTISSTTTTTTSKTSGPNPLVAPAVAEVGNETATTTTTPPSSTITYPEDTTSNQSTDFMERAGEVSSTTDYKVEGHSRANNSSAPAPDVQHGSEGEVTATPAPGNVEYTAANIVFHNVPGAPLPARNNSGDA